MMSGTRVVWTSKGDELRLGSRIGGGGEGDVFDVVGSPNLVAKVYKTPAGVLKSAKLKAMVELATTKPALLAFCAWPKATLHVNGSGPSQGSHLNGVLMPKIVDRKEIHHLTSPTTRKRDFPDKGWSFQIHVAKNLAGAIQTLHEADVIVGDINEKGFLLGQDGTLRVIDCDSFQFAHHGHLFKCEVGVPDYTPPELQSLPGGFSTVVRTENHDAFGLAVIIFKLLFQGRHPFMGRFTGSGDPDLQRFIREYRFAYGRNGQAKSIAPPPHSLHLGALTPQAAMLFDHAFSERAVQDRRPSAKAWYEALSELSGVLTTCAANDGHHFVKRITQCPWCVIERGSGVVFFFGRIAVQRTGWTLNVTYFATALGQFPDLSPGPLPQPPPPSASAPLPVSEPLVRRVRQHRRLRGALIVCGLLLCMMLISLSPGPWLFASGAAVVIGWMLKWPRAVKDEIARREDAVTTLESTLRSLADEWEQLQPQLKVYSSERRTLQEEVRRYSGLQSDHSQGLAELERRKRELQLHDYLEDFSLRAEKIRGIRQLRLATLASFGITTAADITRKQLDAVPGFGDALIRILLAWRQSKEVSFRFDPSKPVDPRDLANLMQRLQSRRRALETAMNSRIRLLTPMAATLSHRQSALAIEAQEEAQSLAQARADLEAMATYK